MIIAGIIMDTQNYKIFSEIDTLKSDYESSSLEKVPGLYRSQSAVIKMCEYYSDSRYLKQNGIGVNNDELGLPGPPGFPLLNNQGLSFVLFDSLSIFIGTIVSIFSS